VRRVTDIVAEISSASQEQSQGIEQVHQAITHMDQVTQQNAALVEEAAAAARSMQDQAVALTRVVSLFRYAQQDHGVVRAKGGMNRTAVAPTLRAPVAPGRVPVRAVAAPPARLASDEWEQF
jgi:methyl-accepting chemotaxis protein